VCNGGEGCITIWDEQQIVTRREHDGSDRKRQRQGLSKPLRETFREEFSVRQKAAAELADIAELAAPALRKALSDTSSAEVKRRLEPPLAKLDTGQIPVAAIRGLRALEVLENVATPEARQVVKDLAKGLPHARLTREARAVLERIGKR
jgi:hypothetical protein